jgi:hypothetical protein
MRLLLHTGQLLNANSSKSMIYEAHQKHDLHITKCTEILALLRSDAFIFQRYVEIIVVLDTC